MSKILIIEDEGAIRRVLVKIIKEENSSYQIEEAEDGCLGFEKIQKEDFDLVLCDIKMPKMDGVEVLSKTQKIKPEIQIGCQPPAAIPQAGDRIVFSQELQPPGACRNISLYIRKSGRSVQGFRGSFLQRINHCIPVKKIPGPEKLSGFQSGFGQLVIVSDPVVTEQGNNNAAEGAQDHEGPEDRIRVRPGQVDRPLDAADGSVLVSRIEGNGGPDEQVHS